MEIDSRLQKIIAEYSPKFIQWTDSINEHNELMFSEDRMEDMEKFHAITASAANTLASIFGVVKRFGNFKDTWDDSKMYQNFYGFELIIKSNKLGNEFYIGIDDKGLFLRAELNHEKNLKNMKDDFWKKLLALSEYEGFEFNQYEDCSREAKKEHPELFYSYKGMIFQIFRKYFFDSIDTSPYSNGVGSVGEFRVNWTGKTPFDVILAELCQVFKTLYELNYSLWKVDDLKKQKSK